jgi:hypothetical protein
VLVVGRKAGRRDRPCQYRSQERGPLGGETEIVYDLLGSQPEERSDRARPVEIGKVNAYLPEWATIGRFLNLHKEFDPDEAE